MMHDVMWDIESLSTKPNAVVLSIGAVKINNYGNAVVGNPFYAVLQTMKQRSLGRHEDADTLQWWGQQSEEARKVLTAEPTYPTVELALGALSEWFTHDGDVVGGVWGNGSDFDNVVIGTLYEDFGITKPWSFRQNRCFRTMRALYADVAAPMRNGTAHNALDDAISQAKWLCRMRQSMQKDARLL